MRVFDIIAMLPKETFIVGQLDGPATPGRWELRRNDEPLSTLDVTGEAHIEAARHGKLAAPRVLVFRGTVDKSALDFARDTVTLVRLAESR